MTNKQVLTLGASKKSVPTSQSLQPYKVMVGLPGEVRTSKLESAFHGIEETEETRPIKVQKIFNLPKNFEVGFFYDSLTRNKKRLWRVILQIELSDEGFPKTKEILISGDNFEKLSDEVVENLLYAERVNPDNLIQIGRGIRYLEVEAITYAIKTLVYTSDLRDGKGQWNFRYMTLSEKFVRKIENETLKRVSYKKNSPEFLKRISKLYLKAEKDGIPPLKYIQVEIGLEESRFVEPRTAENWVRVARSKGYLPKKVAPVIKNSPPIKSVRDAKKPTTKKRSGK